MIRLNENYVIDVDTYGYVAEVDLHFTKYDKRSGKDVPQYKNVGYYTTLGSAVKGVIDHQLKSSLMSNEGEISLLDALKMYERITNEFTEIYKRLEDDLK